ncbi:MAG: glycosyltransferase 61 family protein, partial [Kiritimatiellia bacterium]
ECPLLNPTLCKELLNEYVKEQQPKPSSRFFRDVTPQLKVVPNGYCIPGKNAIEGFNWVKNIASGWQIVSIHDAQGKAVPESGGGLFDSKEISALTQEEMDACEVSDEDVYYLGPYVAQWGHILCDLLLTRLWCALDGEVAKKKFILVQLAHQPPSVMKNVEGLLSLLGILPEQLQIVTRPTRFRTLYVPEVSAVGGQWWSQTYKCTCDALRDAVSPAEVKKVFFGRNAFDWASSKERGEEKLQELFKKAGYRVFTPESLTVAQEIALVKGCSSFVALSGTIPHNLVFAKEGTEAIILQKFEHESSHQNLINEMRTLNVYNLSAFFGFLPVEIGVGPFLLGITPEVKAFALARGWRMVCRGKLSRNDLIWYIKTFVKLNRDALKESWFDVPEIKQNLKNMLRIRLGLEE